MLVLNKFLLTLSSATIIFAGGACSDANRQQKSASDEDELIDASTLDPAEIAAFDREESEPFQGMSLKNCDIRAISKSNDTLALTDLLDPMTLYVRYSQYACGDCIRFLNSALMEYETDTPEVRIRFLLKDVEMRDLHVIENRLGRKFEVYSVDSLPTDFNGAETPYVFWLDDALKVRNYYIPRKELPDSLKAYLYM